ncbi:Hypothetical predicted protein [Olea europaea subsp. europaea]|uniref:Uncharacterized protein n=1 Tax=Olea europaea subsp. europaea TaxID=158383 RepID=A0A8S0UE03_OLEEU|nr:Hypothetical predicted protein [Olea europaea subsp. europaea]
MAGVEVLEEVGMAGVEEAGVEVPEEVEMIEGVEGGTRMPEGETGVPKGVTEEVAEGTPEVVIEGDEGVAEDKRTLEMTDDDVVFVSEGATEVPKGKKRANDAPELMVEEEKFGSGFGPHGLQWTRTWSVWSVTDHSSSGDRCRPSLRF